MQAYAKVLMMGLLLALAGPGIPATSGSPFLDMMRGMATGLALLGQSTTSGSPTTPYSPLQPFPPPAFPPYGGYPWTSGLAGWPPGAYGFPSYGLPPWSPLAPYAGANLLGRFQGSWETDKGGLLLIRDNLARLYLSRDDYQDFYVTADPRYLWLQPVGGATPSRYEHQIYRDRIVLRDMQGRTLVLRRYRPGHARRPRP